MRFEGELTTLLYVFCPAIPAIIQDAGHALASELAGFCGAVEPFDNLKEEDVESILIASRQGHMRDNLALA